MLFCHAAWCRSKDTANEFQKNASVGERLYPMRLKEFPGALDIRVVRQRLWECVRHAERRISRCREIVIFEHLDAGHAHQSGEQTGDLPDFAVVVSDDKRIPYFKPASMRRERDAAVSVPEKELVLRDFVE